jgi:hypothetical protein
LKYSYKLLIVSLTALFLFLSVIPEQDTAYTSTQMFCAYGRLFVEFSEKNYKWGTTWLDKDGRPIPCQPDSNVEKYQKEIYDKSV